MKLISRNTYQILSFNISEYLLNSSAAPVIQENPSLFSKLVKYVTALMPSVGISINYLWRLQSKQTSICVSNSILVCVLKKCKIF